MNAAVVLNIEAAVVRLLAEQLGVTEENVARENTLEDLGADSLDLIEIVMAAEDEFSIIIDDEEAEQLRTVGQVIDLVRRKRDPESTVPG